MINRNNWLYVPYKFREPDGHVVPRGPNFARAQTIQCDIDGTLLRFRAPRHRPSSNRLDEIVPEPRYTSETMIFRSNFDASINVSDNWEQYPFLRRDWAFYGPWFTGTLAELRMSSHLVKPVNYKNMDFSLFHPRAFETIVADYITNLFSRYMDKFGELEGKLHYIAPVGWQPLSHLPVVAVRLQVVPDEAVTIDTIRHFFFFPLDDHLLFVAHFIPSQLRVGTQEELDRRVSRAPMYALMDNIINSFSLELSPEAEARQQKALAGLEDTSLVKDFAPLKWKEGTPQQQAPQQRGLEHDEPGLFG